MRPLILFGGGLDSCAMVELYHHLDPALLHFNYGQKALIGEHSALDYFANKYQLASDVIDIDEAVIPAGPLTTEAAVLDASDHHKNYIDGRNLLFSAYAFAFARANGYGQIMLGASPAPPESAFHDAKLCFQRKFNELVDQSYPDAAEVTYLFMPLVTGNRREYLSRALFREPKLFEVSFTCYESVTLVECGKCVHCQQKIKLAKELGASMRASVDGGARWQQPT